MFTLAIIQILKLNALSVNSPPLADGTPDALHVHLYFLVAFLSGFSERFASDLIGRAEQVVSTPVGAVAGAGGSEKHTNAAAAS
jgi:hypothetical protein